MANLRIVAAATNAPTGGSSGGVQLRIAAAGVAGAPAIYSRYYALGGSLVPVKRYVTLGTGALHEVRRGTGGVVVVPPKAAGARWGVISSDSPSKPPNWDATKAELGISNLHVRRVYCDPGTNVNSWQSWIEGEARTNDILPFISNKIADYTNPNGTISTQETQLRAMNLPLVGLLYGVEHEPMGNTDSTGRAITPAYWISAQFAMIAACVRLQAAGKRIFPALVPNGFWFDDPRNQRSRIGYDLKSWLPDNLMAALEAAGGVLAPDIYDRANNPYTNPKAGTATPSTSPGTKARNVVKWARGEGFAETGPGATFQPACGTYLSALGVGECGTFDYNNAMDTMQTLGADFQVICWWNRRDLGMSLEAVSPTNPKSAAYKAEFLRQENLVSVPWRPRELT